MKHKLASTERTDIIQHPLVVTKKDQNVNIRESDYSDSDVYKTDRIRSIPAVEICAALGLECFL